MHSSELSRPRGGRHSVRMQIHVDTVLVRGNGVGKFVGRTYEALVAEDAGELPKEVELGDQVLGQVEALGAFGLLGVLVDDQVDEYLVAVFGEVRSQVGEVAVQVLGEELAINGVYV